MTLLPQRAGAWRRTSPAAGDVLSLPVISTPGIKQLLHAASPTLELLRKLAHQHSREAVDIFVPPLILNLKLKMLELSIEIIPKEVRKSFSIHCWWSQDSSFLFEMSCSPYLVTTPGQICENEMRCFSVFKLRQGLPQEESGGEGYLGKRQAH